MTDAVQLQHESIWSFTRKFWRNLFAGWKGSESRGQMVKTQANGMIAAQTDALVVMLIIKYKL